MDPRSICLEPEQWLAYCEKRANAEVFSNLLRLDAGEARALAAILAHLAELDGRRPQPRPFCGYAPPGKPNDFPAS